MELAIFTEDLKCGMLHFSEGLLVPEKRIKIAVKA